MKVLIYYKLAHYQLMRILIVTLLLVTSSAFAGDLSLICFKNGDVGDYLEVSDEFMSTNTKSISFEHNQTLYKVFVSRKSLFENYHYAIYKVNPIDSSFTVQEKDAPNYNDWIQVDSDITCTVED